MTLTVNACAPVAFKPLGEIDDDKVTSMLADFFSRNWVKAKNGDVKAAVELQHYVDRASGYGKDYEMANKILDKMTPVAAAQLRQAIATGSVISFD